MSNSCLDYAALDRHLQSLRYLFIDTTRLKIDDVSNEKRGGYGDVRLSILDAEINGGRRVATKRFRLKEKHKEPGRIAFSLVRELKVWANLQHPNILPLLGYYLDDELTEAILISEFMLHGDLGEFIEKEHPSWTLCLSLVIDATKGLHYLHTREPPVCHADIKINNVLVNRNRRGVLADFGLSKALDEPLTGLTTTTELRGTPLFWSPELITDLNPKYTLSSDIWAWACLALQVLAGKLPYGGPTSHFGIITKLNSRECPAKVDEISIQPPSIRRLLAECWKIEPNARPSAFDCISYISSSLSNYRHSDPKVMAEISQLHSELLEGGYRKEENEKGDRLEVAQVADTPGQQRSLDETRSSTLTGSSLLIFDPQHNKDRRVSDSPGVRVGRPHESEIYQPYEDSTRFVTQSRHSNPQQQSRPQSNHMPEQARQSMGSMGAQIPGLGLMGQATTGSRRQLATPTRTGPQPHISGNGFATQLRPGFQGWELENDGDGTDPWGNFVEVLPGIGTGRLVEALQTQNPNPNLNPGQNALLQLVAHHLSGMTPQQLANLPPHQRKQWCQILENQQQQQALAQVQQQIQQQQQQQRQQRKQQAQQQQGQLGFNPGQDQQQQQSLGGQIPGLAQTEQSSGGFPGRQPPQQAENTVQGNGPDGPLFLDQIVNLPLEAFRNQLVTFKGKIKALEDQRDRLVQIKTPQALEQAQKFQLQVNGLNGVMQQLTEAFARRQATAMGLQPTQPGGQGVQQPSAMAGANQGSAQNRPGMGGQGPQDGLGGGGGGAQLPIGWPQNMPHLVQQLSRERMQALVNAGGVPAPNQSPQQQSMQQQPPEQQQPPPRALARL